MAPDFENYALDILQLTGSVSIYNAGMIVDLLNQIVLRWESDSDCAALLESGGIDAVWLQRQAGHAPGIEALGPDAIRLTGRDEAGPPSGLTATKAGVWPGARASARSSDGSFTAGASQRAWIDAERGSGGLVEGALSSTVLPIGRSTRTAMRGLRKTRW